MSSLSRAPTQRFSDRVENYVRYRPSYPEPVIELLRSEAGLTRGSAVADVGTGTGIFAKLLLGAGLGCRVFGVEPNREMRQAAERLLEKDSSFHSVDGTAEETTLPDRSVNLVTAAQAFHWFDAAKARIEFSRILKTGGHVALIWNERRIDATPFLCDYERLLLAFATDYAKVRHENVGEKELSAFFKDGKFAAHAMTNSQGFDFEGLKGRLLSSSYAPAAGQAGHESMMQELGRIFERHHSGGTVRFEYVTRIYLGR